ncbi:anti-sigma factor [Bacteroidia bacterium]|nr:anti-sigma factor [Bacteroidia bacterium]
MQMNYHKYAVSDFLKDDSFILWRLLGEESDYLFWTHFMEEHPEKQDTINEAIRIFKSVHLNDYSLSPEKKEQLWRDLQQSIATTTRDRRRTRYFTLSAIAGVAAMLALAFWLMPDAAVIQSPNTVALVEQSEQPTYNDTDIRLELANKETVVLEQDAVIQYTESSITVTANNQPATSTKIKADHKKKEWNKLTVPKGKRTSLILSDGTKIWVNSGSYLEFPPAFDEDKREIKIEGEIYIEVSRDTNHPFRVYTSDMKINVLGTRFNVSAYEEDAVHQVVLVEGNVEVTPGKREPVRLSPDHMLAISANKIKTSKVDVYSYISWKDGLLQFNSEPLSLVLARISRYYNRTLTYEDNIKDLKCTGKLVLFDDLATVLQTISHTLTVTYEIKENTIHFSNTKNKL